jgi:hypothetical protein
MFPLLRNLARDSSSYVVPWLTLHMWTLNCTVAPIVCKITPPQGPHRKHSFYCWWGVFTARMHSNGSYSIVTCVFVEAGMCLPSRCLAMNVYSDFTIPAFRRHVTVLLLNYSLIRALDYSRTNSLNSPIHSRTNALTHSPIWYFAQTLMHFLLHTLDICTGKRSWKFAEI